MIKILIWQVRAAHGLTLRELAERSGVPRSTLHRIECEQQSPTLAQLAAVAAALEVKIEDLYRIVK